ncbi:MAG: hypothetical protein ACJAZO_000752 [Myxococcota bacterium]|jgi:hypothetical protein
MGRPSRHPETTVLNSRLFLACTALFLGCRSDPTEKSFYENVGSAFDRCSPGEIRALSVRHNFMLAFEACGSNNFSNFTWSPTGTHLFFQLPNSHHIQHSEVETKNTIIVPTDVPVGPSAWLDTNRIAIPVAAEAEGGPLRVQVFDQVQLTVRPYAIPGLTELADFQGTPDALYFTGVASGQRQIYRMATDDGAVTSPFAWTAALTAPITTFTYNSAASAVAIGSNATTRLYDATTGDVRGEWPRANRGILQPRGEWLALEYTGEPIPLFHQRSWDELPPHLRERERRRAQAFEETLPHWYPTDIPPPRISMVNLANGERWDFTGFYGDHFEWYAADDNYVSFILWGYESKQMNTNVTLGSLADRLRAIEEGEEMFGLAKWQSADTPPPIDPPELSGVEPVPAAPVEAEGTEAEGSSGSEAGP